MIENIIEEIKYVWENGPTTLVALPLIVGSLVATACIAYSLHKNPPKLPSVEDKPLIQEDSNAMGYLKERNILKDDGKDRWYIEKSMLDS